MRPTRIVRVATRAIWVNKLRSVLNTFGIIVGVGAIVSVMSIGNGSRETIQEQLDELGRNLIFVRPLETGTLAPIESLTLGDADAIASGLLRFEPANKLLPALSSERHLHTIRFAILAWSKASSFHPRTSRRRRLSWSSEVRSVLTSSVAYLQ